MVVEGDENEDEHGLIAVQHMPNATKYQFCLLILILYHMFECSDFVADNYIPLYT